MRTTFLLVGIMACRAVCGAQEGEAAAPSVKESAAAVLEKLGLEFYGHFKLDMSRDTAETNYGNTALWVKKYTDGAQDEETNISARHTRLGLNWNGPQLEGITGFGKLELDFLGKAVQPTTEAEELQSAVRLRHAYLSLDFGGGWSLLGGQTWDVFAPHNMTTLNTCVGWAGGNIAYRRPQLRVKKVCTIGETSSVTCSFAVARPVGFDQDGNGQDDGDDSGYPDVQGHVGLKVPFLTAKPLEIGFGGFFGWREVDAYDPTLVRDDRYHAYAGALDVKVPLLDNLCFLGEGWAGQGLGSYRAAVFQNYSTRVTRIDVISAAGGFGNLVWRPHTCWRLAAGGGIDDPDNGDIATNSQREYNKTVFGNVVYSFYKGASVGIEYQWIATDYRDRNDRTNHRVQMSFMLKF